MKPKLAVLDQLLVLKEKVSINILDVEVAWTMIRKMQLRGAPFIAIVTCLSIAVDLSTNLSTLKSLESTSDNDAVKEIMTQNVDYCEMR